MLNSILQKLEGGSRPCIPLNHVIQRKDIWDNIETTFLIGISRMSKGFGMTLAHQAPGRQWPLGRHVMTILMAVILAYW